MLILSVYNRKFLFVWGVDLCMLLMGHQIRYLQIKCFSQISCVGNMTPNAIVCRGGIFIRCLDDHLPLRIIVIIAGMGSFEKNKLVIKVNSVPFLAHEFLHFSSPIVWQCKGPFKMPGPCFKLPKLQNSNKFLFFTNSLWYSVTAI